MTNEQIIKSILAEKPANSAWQRAVQQYALDILQDLEPNTVPTELYLLCGARNWKEYSWAGFNLCYNYDIAKRCCTPSEFKKTKEGMYKPNSQEDWLDVQARALYQASRKILNYARMPYCEEVYKHNKALLDKQPYAKRTSIKHIKAKW